MSRFGGMASMMCLPVATTPLGLDAAFIGVPLDIGNTPCYLSFDIDSIDPTYATLRHLWQHRAAGCQDAV